MEIKNRLTIGRIVGEIFCFIIIVLIVVFSLAPFIWLVFASLKSNSDILSGSFIITDGIHFENYIIALKNSPIVQFFWNSLAISLGGTLLNIFVSSMAAYVMSRFEFKGKGILSVCFASILVVPAVALLQPLFSTMNDLNLYDTKLSLMIVYSGLGLATSFFIMKSYYATIPNVLDEAAAIDGTGFFGTYFKIILPLSTPAIATAGVLQFLLCWNEFTFALTLTSGNTSRTLPLALSYFLSQFASDYGAMFAAATMVAMPSIVIFIVLQKQVIEGLTAGSVKG